MSTPLCRCVCVTTCVKPSGCQGVSVSHARWERCLSHVRTQMVGQVLVNVCPGHRATCDVVCIVCMGCTVSGVFCVLGGHRMLGPCVSLCCTSGLRCLCVSVLVPMCPGCRGLSVSICVCLVAVWVRMGACTVTRVFLMSGHYLV